MEEMHKAKSVGKNVEPPNPLQVCHSPHTSTCSPLGCSQNPVSPLPRGWEVPVGTESSNPLITLLVALATRLNP